MVWVVGITRLLVRLLTMRGRESGDEVVTKQACTVSASVVQFTLLNTTEDCSCTYTYCICECIASKQQMALHVIDV